MTVRSVITIGTIAAIRKFRHECIGERGPIRAAGRVAHEQRLKNRPAKAEAQNIFDDHLGQAGNADDARNHRAGENAEAVAGDAMHGRSQRLAPARGGVAFVQSGQGLATAENIKERAEHPGIGGQQHEPPFQNGRFRRRADVDCDEQQRQRGQ
jgi:hypothetical protein